jgi:ferredoxin-NADP reductase
VLTLIWKAQVGDRRWVSRVNVTGDAQWAGLRSFRIADVVRESRSIASLVLEPVDGEPLPAFPPGQFLTVRVRPIGAPRALLRSFSLSAAPIRSTTA